LICCGPKRPATVRREEEVKRVMPVVLFARQGCKYEHSASTVATGSAYLDLAEALCADSKW